MAPRITQTQFIQKCKQTHSNRYDLSQTVYVNRRTKITVLCRIHGKFTTNPDYFANGCNCVKCSLITGKRTQGWLGVNKRREGKSSFRVFANRYVGGFNPSKPAILYYLSINNGAAYKIGITNKSVEKRFSLTERSRITVVKIWYYKLGAECAAKERYVINKYKQHKYTGPKLLRSGHTEMFNIDVLKTTEYNKL